MQITIKQLQKAINKCISLVSSLTRHQPKKIEWKFNNKMHTNSPPNGVKFNEY